MAEENDVAQTPASDGAPDIIESRRARGRRVPARSPMLPALVARVTPRRRADGAPRGGIRRPLRTVVILSMVGGLVATVALPAYAAWNVPTDGAVTVQQMAAEDAQSLVVASDSSSEELSRDSYAATTPEEIEKKKAEEAAAAAARSVASSGASYYSMNLSMTAPGSGEVRWPVTNFTYASYNLFRAPNRPNHEGFDMVTGAGTPIFASIAGQVTLSQESYSGYGNCIIIVGTVGGQTVSTLYAHMLSGSRQVQVGQWVSAGQVIGAVGSTGQSTANHLHFEVRINGTLVDPLAWLQTNAG